ncbi:hypothetical protein [Oceanomicrobium pacificus]|uniref:Lipopolysaccharide export system protein LptC n=1 Tax=Oceanomicrobium pacificus TaxID=2692916 RepID=A0A6B0TTX0_9RHOB|nr:hypothetical protein [Oceanomicrobium pacificus]MXU64682.1 hypothetical protein [Oceanomicrobium pacificus]
MRQSPGAYSRFVRATKIGLPLLAILILSTLFLVSTRDDFDGIGLSFTEADLEAMQQGLSVTSPVLTGQNARGDLFRFTADTVVPDSLMVQRAVASNLRGRIDFANGQGLDLRTDSAELDLGTQKAQFEGAVRLTTDEGYDLATDRIDADLEAGVITGPDPVTAVAPMGRISSDAFSIRSGEGADFEAEKNVIRFENNVKLVFTPNRSR